MSRDRKTWKQAEQDKTASPPPQTPAVDRTEGPSHPAYYPDPDQDKYEKGDTSAWAEDPHKPMSPETPPPAMPGNLTTEDLTHPATSDFQKKPETPEQASGAGGGGGSKQASLTQMAEQRAGLCLRIAGALMPNATVSDVENRALTLMDLEDAQLQATAKTLNVLAGEEEEIEEEVEELEIEGGKKAAVEITARLAGIEASMGRLVKAMAHFFSMQDEDGMSDKELMAFLVAEDGDGGVDQNEPDYAYTGDKAADGHEEMPPEMDDEGGEEEAMLKAMLEEMDTEMSMMASDKSDKDASEAVDNTDPLAKGNTIQSGEGGNVNPDDYAPTPVVAQSDGSDKNADPTPHGGKQATEDTGVAENDIQLTAGDDPMGLTDKDASVEPSADDELMQLYADLNLPKAAGEDKEEAKEEPADAGAGTDEKAEADDAAFGADDEKKGGKKADLELKPQPKAASAGAQTLGNVAGHSKAASSDLDLSKLWDHAPDVSAVFGVTPTS